MFLLDYFDKRGVKDMPGVARLSLIWLLQLYLTDFLKSTFLRENAKNRGFYGAEKLKTATVYPSGINHPCGAMETGVIFTPFLPLSFPALSGAAF